MGSTFAPFFGGNVNADRYVRAAYKGSDFTTPRYPTEDSLKDSAMEELMNPDNYVTPAGARPAMQGKLPESLYDFMYLVGEYHRKLDNVQKLGMDQYEKGRQRFIENLNKEARTIARQMVLRLAAGATPMATVADPTVWGDCSSPVGGVSNKCFDVVDFDEFGSGTQFALSPNEFAKALGRLAAEVEKEIAISSTGSVDDMETLVRNVKQVLTDAFNTVYASSKGFSGSTAYVHLNQAGEARTFFEKHLNALMPPASTGAISQVNMDHDLALSFIKQNIGVFARVGNANLTNADRPPTSFDAGYVRLTDEELTAMAKKGIAALPELDGVRLNLLKSPDNPSVTVFRAAIPGGPDGPLGKAYDDGNNGVGGGVGTGPGVPLPLDEGKFFAAVARADDRATTKEECVDIETDPCNDLVNKFVDVAYGRVWNWDCDANNGNGEYYAMINGERKSYSEVQHDKANCYGTYLTKGGKCQRVLDCLVLGDSSSLNACLDILNDTSIWEVAKSDVEKSDPYNVKLVLKKFGVKGRWEHDAEGKKYMVPMNYDEWREELKKSSDIDDTTKKAIMGNSTLNTYLKALLGVCAANPAIINKRDPAVPGRGTGLPIPAAVKELGRKPYWYPIDPTDNKYAVTAALLRSLPQNTFQTYYSPVIGSLNNASMFTNRMVSQAGGGAVVAAPYLLTDATRLTGRDLTLSDGSGNLFDSLYKAVQAGLGDMGVVMDEGDDARIKATIKKLQELEGALLKVVQRINQAVRIADAYGANHYVHSRDGPRPVLSLDDVSDESSARRFIEQHLQQLTGSYSTLNGHYSGLADNLVRGVLPRFFDRCCPATEEKKTASNWVDLSEPCPDC